MNITDILLFWVFGVFGWIVFGYSEHNRPMRLRDVVFALFWPVVSVGTFLVLFLFLLYNTMREIQGR